MKGELKVNAQLDVNSITGTWESHEGRIESKHHVSSKYCVLG